MRQTVTRVANLPVNSGSGRDHEVRAFGVVEWEVEVTSPDEKLAVGREAAGKNREAGADQISGLMHILIFLKLQCSHLSLDADPAVEMGVDKGSIATQVPLAVIGLEDRSGAPYLNVGTWAVGCGPALRGGLGADCRGE